MLVKSKFKSVFSGPGQLIVLSCGLVVLTLMPAQAQQERQPTSTSNSIVTEQVALQNLLEVKQKEKKKETVPNTPTANQPTIGNAKTVALSGANSSLRAYFFDNEKTAESFAQAIATFKIATRFKLVVSATENAMYDADNKKIVMPPSHAEQFKIDSSKVVLLAGTHKQHTRVEQLMRALGAE